MFDVFFCASEEEWERTILYCTQGQQLIVVSGVHSLVLKTNCLLVNSEGVRAVQGTIRLDRLGTNVFPLKQKGYENMPIT